MSRLHQRISEMSVTNFFRLAKNAVMRQVNSDGTTTTLSASLKEINRVADVSSRLVTLTADTTLTAADHSDKIILLGEVGGDASLTATLPAATGSGARYHFKVSVVNTSNYVVKVANASDVIGGTMMNLADGGDTVVGFEADGTDDTITLNGTTTGGVAIGDYFELVDMATNQYSVHGNGTASGAEATPFSATVS